jgi:hypothetical protein
MYALYGDGENAPGQRVLWCLDGRKSQWWPADQVDTFAEAAVKAAAGTDVFFGIALQDQAAAVEERREEERLEAAKEGRSPRPITPEWVRGSANTALAIPGLWVEVDWADPVHKATNLPPTRDAALALINEFELAPSIVLNSGHGLHGWWLFAELWNFDTESKRRDAQDLVERFQATIRTKAARHGWTVDTTSDLARVLRLPGTWNRKREPAIPVELVSMDASRRYSPDDFEFYLVELPAAERADVDGDMPSARTPNNLTDIQIIKWARYAHGEKFALLWAGEWIKASGKRRADEPPYGSQSAADYALIGILRFWTGGDAKKIDRLFRESGLMRPKWDERHFSGGKTYGEGTIRRSLRGVFETYTPPSPRLEVTPATHRVDPVTGEVLEEIDGFQHLPPLSMPRTRKLPPLKKPDGTVLPPIAKPHGVAIEELLERGA